eukprot:jgi/Orpsp1_1/1189320/evm.model.d7180000071106.1
MSNTFKLTSIFKLPDIKPKYESHNKRKSSTQINNNNIKTRKISNLKSNSYKLNDDLKLNEKNNITINAYKGVVPKDINITNKKNYNKKENIKNEDNKKSNNYLGFVAPKVISSSSTKINYNRNSSLGLVENKNSYDSIQHFNEDNENNIINNYFENKIESSSIINQSLNGNEIKEFSSNFNKYNKSNSSNIFLKNNNVLLTDSISKLKFENNNNGNDINCEKIYKNDNDSNDLKACIMNKNNNQSAISKNIHNNSKNVLTQVNKELINNNEISSIESNNIGNIKKDIEVGNNTLLAFVYNEKKSKEIKNNVLISEVKMNENRSKEIKLDIFNTSEKSNKENDKEIKYDSLESVESSNVVNIRIENNNIEKEKFLISNNKKINTDKNNNINIEKT